MAWPDDPRDLKVGFAFGHNDAENPSLLTFETVSPNEDDEGDPGPVLQSLKQARGRIGDASTTDATEIALALRDTDGDFSPRNVSGAHYGQLRNGTPVQTAVDVGSGDVVLGTAFVPEWNPTWTGPDLDDQVAVNALGVLAKLGRDDEVKSALHRDLGSRFNSAHFATNFWPMEDGPSSTQFGSAVPHGFPMSVNSVEFAGEEGPPGSSSVAVFDATTRIRGPVYWPTAALGGFYAAVLLKFPDSTPPGSSTTLLEVQCSGGTATRWVYSADGTNTTLTGFDESGGTVFTDSNADASTAFALLDDWCVLEIRSSDSSFGGVLSATITRVSDGTATASLGGVGTGHTSGTVTLATIPASAELDGVAVGHLVVAPVAPTDFAEAARGYDGEAAADRIQRLCVEDGIPLSVTAGDSTLMGPQKPGAILPLLRECEAADHGVLYEARDGRMAYQTRTARYNLPVSLALQYGSEEDPDADISDLRMFDDNRDLYNLITVTRVDGSSVTREQTDGTVGTDETEGVGARPLPVTLNLATDDQLADHAGWLLRAGTIDKPRFILVLDLFNKPSLAASVLACDIGSRITITGAPAKHVGPDDLDLIIEGEVLDFDATRGLVMWWCEPYDLWDIGTYGADAASATKKYDTLGTTTAEALDTTETGVDVTNAVVSGVQVQWGTNTPYDIVIGGEVMTVTNVSGTGASQTLTVTRSVNGVVKTHDSGVQVRLAPDKRGRYGL